ncbi:hypothetical protein LZZ85_23655 [Terrimonas sp. NA20]|uniref:Lysoplasmalogenase n=1 Tax=Terrimonas ginsenosidimutans TaxID=2908004 RepID=A0ABS9KYC6_9BACT|nr:DUF6580 family putative transport protein [Terrimonas ginsenosidimutans]MCG2617313.1 hypothetical protein [Terrimonas ginsenosidimutans]
MKLNKSTIWAFVILLIVAALYRSWEGRPFGFAPQMAMALFGGAVISDKRFAVLLPVLSLFLSDMLYQVLYMNGLSPIQGFYEGQWVIYLLFVGITFFGMLMKKIDLKNILGFTISGSIIFFLVSNFAVWAGGGGLKRPRTLEGLGQCYGDALAFFRDYGVIKGFVGNQLIGDLFFSLVLFGAFALARNFFIRPAVKTA